MMSQVFDIQIHDFTYTLVYGHCSIASHVLPPTYYCASPRRFVPPVRSLFLQLSWNISRTLDAPNSPRGSKKSPFFAVRVRRLRYHSVNPQQVTCAPALNLR